MLIYGGAPTTDLGGNSGNYGEVRLVGGSVDLYSGVNGGYGRKLTVDTTGHVGVGAITSLLTHPLHVFGIARSSQATFATTSDRRVKKDIAEFENALDLIDQLRPVKYSWKNDYKSTHPELKDGTYGFVSQEVQKVIPEMVTEVKEEFGDKTIEDFKLLNMDALFPISVQAIQEQQEMIEDVQAENKKLRSELEDVNDRFAALEAVVAKLASGMNNCCENFDENELLHSSEAQVPSVSADVFLSQNFPNPFETTTTIYCHVPLHAQQADLIVQSVDGQVISRKNLSLGENSVIFHRGELAPGFYLYSLVVDGAIESSKKMTVLN